MRLSAHDASFIYSETASGPMHGFGFTTFKGVITYEEMFKYTEDRIHLVPRLRQRLVFVPFNMAHPKWVDDPNFDLRNHLVNCDVPEGMTMAEARAKALELGEGVLNRDRPLWINYLFSGVEGNTLLVQLAHHAMVDGATAVAMVMVLTDMEPEPPAPPPAEPWYPKPLQSGFALTQEALREQGENLQTNLINSVQNAMRPESIEKATRLFTRLTRPVMQAPWNASAVGPKRQFAYMEKSLDDIKVIRKSLGGTVNDVVLAVVVEAAARYMKSKGEQVDEQYLRIMCPVNIRPPDNDPLTDSGNHVSAMFPIFAAWPKSMAARYVETKTEMNGIKERGEVETLHQLQSSQPNFPPVMMAPTQIVGTQFDPTQLLANNPAPVQSFTGLRPQQFGFNFTITNVPGPNWQQYVCGKELERQMSTIMLGGNLGMGVAMVSGNGQMVFGITSDPRLLPEIEQLRDLMIECFAELTAEAKSN